MVKSTEVGMRPERASQRDHFAVPTKLNSTGMNKRMIFFIDLF